MKTFCLTLLITPALVLAESLESLVATALEKNPELAAARAKWDAARQQALQVRTLEDPIIGVTLERMGTMRPDNVTDAEWMASQKLPWPGKRTPKIRAARFVAEVAGFEYLEQRRRVQAGVESAYADLWQVRESVRLMAAMRDVIAQTEKVVRARYETGAVMQTDLLRLQMEVARINNDLVVLEREVPVAEAALNQWLNAPSTTPRTTVSLELPVLPHSLDELLGRARQYCCILMARLRALEAKRAALEAANRESWPDVELRLAARQYSSGVKEFDSGVGINIPWLWRGKYRAMTAEAQAEIKMAEANFTAELNTTQLAVKEHYTKTETARRQIDLLEKTILPQARQLIIITRANYETGKATMTELLEAQRTLLDFELQQARARAEFAKSFAQLNQNTAPWDAAAIATGLVPPDMQ